MKANFSLSFSCKGVVEKQYFKSITVRDHPLGNKKGKGIPDCRESIGWITLLIALRSVTILHFPDFFLTTNTGEFQGLVDSSICWASSCSCTSYSRACGFSIVKGHCLTHAGLSVNHFKIRAVDGFEISAAVVPCSCTTWMVGDCSL